MVNVRISSPTMIITVSEYKEMKQEIKELKLFKTTVMQQIEQMKKQYDELKQQMDNHFKTHTCIPKTSN